MVIQRILWLCCSLLVLPCMVYADALTASIDRNQMRIGESVQLTVTLQGSADSEPDFTPLQRQFELVGKNKSSNIQIINGSMSRSTQWLITLMPKKTGQLSIPPIHAGTLVSARVRLQVLPENQSTTGMPADVFLEVSALPLDVYVQQQILCTVRLFRAINLTQAQLNEPDVLNASVERLGKDTTYKTQRQGRSYIVTERRYAIFPQQHGRITIPALQFTGRASSGSGLFMQSGRVLRKSSQPIHITVHAIPSLWSPVSEWLPASALVLHDKGLDSASIHVGDALTRSIRIEATGLTAAQLPPLATTSIPDVFRAYPDQPSLTNQQQPQGILGVREEKMALIATKSGTFTLPAIRLPWWNTQTGRIDIAEIPARTLIVLPPLNQTTPPSTMPTTKQQSMEEQAATTNNSLPITQSPPWTGWRMVAIGLGIGWLLTLLLQGHRAYNSKKNNQEAAIQQQENERWLRKKALQACRQNKAKSAASALIQWGQHLAPTESINNIPQLATYLKKHDPQWSKALLQLDRSLYAEQKKAWDGAVVYALTKDWKAAPIELVNKNDLPLLM